MEFFVVWCGCVNPAEKAPPKFRLVAKIRETPAPGTAVGELQLLVVGQSCPTADLSKNCGAFAIRLYQNFRAPPQLYHF